MCGIIIHIQCAATEIRRGKEDRRRRYKETTGWKYNGLPYSIGNHNIVVFNTEDLVLIEVFCQEKRYNNMNNHTASLEITVNVHESVLSRKLVFWTSNWKHVIKYDLCVKFPRIFAHKYKYVLNSLVKISMIFAKYFAYYTIILEGRFLWTRCTT